jgi:hypothetical protein
VHCMYSKVEVQAGQFLYLKISYVQAFLTIENVKFALFMIF